METLEFLAWELYYIACDIVCPEPDIDDTPYIYCNHCGDEIPSDNSLCGCEKEERALLN